MPRGIYPRTANQLESAKINLAKGRSPEVRARVRKKLKENASDPEWRKKVSEATRKAMRRPDVRERHLKGLAKAFQIHGTNFRGGNGQRPVKIICQLEKVLEPLGFVREHPIKTKGHGTGLRAPTCYKADFADPLSRIAIEVDGPSHCSLVQKARDEKKTAVLEALGWKVYRITHSSKETDDGQ